MEDIYQQCVAMTKGLLRRNKSSESPEHYVNEAYLLLHEKGSAITLQALYEKARIVFLHEADCDIRKPEFTRQTTKVCGACKNDLPVGAFGLSYDKTLKRRRVNRLCRECDRKKSKMYPKAKASINLKKMVEQLSDGYIKKNLRALGWANKNIKPVDIEICRQRIRKKRLLKTMYGSQK